MRRLLGILFLSPALALAGTTATMDVPLLSDPLVADVPAGTQGNDGAAGFHKDEAIYVMVKAVADEAPSTIDKQKKDIEQFAFKKWISSKKTADGWVLTYVMNGMDMSGKLNTKYAFNVRRKIGDKSYECSGAVTKKGDVDANVKICASLRTKG